MNAPKTFTQPLHVTRRILACAVVLEDARRVPVAYLRGGRPEEEAEYMAHAVNFHRALLEGLEKAALALESAAEGFELFGRPTLEREARDAQEAAELLLAQARGTVNDSLTVGGGRGA
ncbi:MAG TPA: hypothetical protein VK465_06970 [Fibrobacteria bacterium]|nr:hypothetical protein [Geothrix sp.]HLP41232.1 hypothetical protein [Fibrobacteria bacterium]